MCSIRISEPQISVGQCVETKQRHYFTNKIIWKMCLLPFGTFFVIWLFCKETCLILIKIYCHICMWTKRNTYLFCYYFYYQFISTCSSPQIHRLFHLTSLKRQKHFYLCYNLHKWMKEKDDANNRNNKLYANNCYALQYYTIKG